MHFWAFKKPFKLHLNILGASECVFFHRLGYHLQNIEITADIVPKSKKKNWFLFYITLVHYLISIWLVHMLTLILCLCWSLPKVNKRVLYAQLANCNCAFANFFASHVRPQTCNIRKIDTIKLSPAYLQGQN